MTTLIEWADVTINPVVGCSHCSPGCANCYAERFAVRLAKHPNPKISGKYAGVVDGNGKWTGVIDFSLCSLERLPLKPKRIFIGSMCDMFHDSVMDYHLEQILNYITVNPQHTFIFLTKRPERMHSFFANLSPAYSHGFKNIWLGLTVCNQAEADEKIPVLLGTPAAKRFVSVEPMLGPIDLDKNEFLSPWRSQIDRDLPFIDWVICGGETGPGARPMHPDWVRSLRDQCQAAGTPFFFKGWGEWVAVSYDDYPDWQRRDSGKGIFANLDPERGMFWDRECTYRPDENGIQRKIYGTDLMHRVGKRLTGRLLDGVEHNEFPEVSC